jgi:hypothetical protein
MWRHKTQWFYVTVTSSSVPEEGIFMAILLPGSLFYKQVNPQSGIVSTSFVWGSSLKLSMASEQLNAGSLWGSATQQFIRALGKGKDWPFALFLSQSNRLHSETVIGEKSFSFLDVTPPPHPPPLLSPQLSPMPGGKGTHRKLKEKSLI